MNIIKLKKGLNIKLTGEAEKCLYDGIIKVEKPLKVGIVPDDFVGVKPQMVVKEGDMVGAGDALFVNKRYPDVKFVSPIDGVVTAIVRGDRRKVMCVVVEENPTVSPHPISKKTDENKSLLAEEISEKTSIEEIVNLLADKGLLGFINQMPYAISANNKELPARIFISAFRDMPLAADVDFCLQGKADDWTEGLKTLARIAPVYVGLDKNTAENSMFVITTSENDITYTIFDGKCPAGNVNVQINHVAPINKGEIVWTVEPEVVAFIGHLIRTGRVDFHKKIALCGSEVKRPIYKEVVVGQQIDSVLEECEVSDAARIINGNVLTGKKTDRQGFVGAHAYELTMIPEGDENAEFLGWIAPMCMRDRKPADARIKGGRRNMIMSGEYDRVLPMDIYGEYLIKAIITKDIDKMELLGIYEVAPEDFALAEYVDSSKLELQRIVREGLDMLRKENE